MAPPAAQRAKASRTCPQRCEFEDLRTWPGLPGRADREDRSRQSRSPGTCLQGPSWARRVDHPAPRAVGPPHSVLEPERPQTGGLRKGPQGPTLVVRMLQHGPAVVHRFPGRRASELAPRRPRWVQVPEASVTQSMIGAQSAMIRKRASHSASSASTALRPLISREEPTRPTTAPPGSRSGALVENQAARIPSLQLNRSPIGSVAPPSMTRRSFAMMAMASLGRVGDRPRSRRRSPPRSHD